MRMLRKLFVVALFVAVLILGWQFAAENSAAISIHYIAGRVEGIALWAALLASFAAGAMSVGVLATFRVAKVGMVARRYRKTALGLEAEVHQLRNLPLSSEEPATDGSALELSARASLERDA